MIVCVENFEEYKKYDTWEEKRDLKECINDLIEIAKNIEGPLHKIIEDATKQMDCYKNETLYKGTETKPFLKEDSDKESKSNDLVERKSDSAFSLKPENHGIFKLLTEYLMSIDFIKATIANIKATIVTVIGGIILFIITKKYLS